MINLIYFLDSRKKELIKIPSMKTYLFESKQQFSFSNKK